MYFYSQFFVLINGTSVSFFHISKGFKQRDPLSPYLFVLAMEALSFLLKKARDRVLF